MNKISSNIFISGQGRQKKKIGVIQSLYYLKPNKARGGGF